MDKEKYVNLVVRKLVGTKKKKEEIKRELESDIQSAIENGENWMGIEERMGTPSQVSAEFNENLSESERKNAKKNKRMKTIGIIIVVVFVLIGGIYSLLPKSYEIGKSGIFTEQSVIEQAEMVIELINKEEYSTIKSEYSNKKLSKIFEGTILEDAKAKVGPDWGEFQSFTSIYTVEVKQMGRHMAVAQITALYKNRSVTYTISFNEDMKLSGLYMK